MLGSLASERIVILSTHIVEDIESTCEQIAILDNGKIAYSGSVGKLLERARGFIWGGLVGADKLEYFRERFILLSSVRESDSIRVRILSDIKPFETAENISPSIEDGYMKIIKGVG
jgi:ABC-2 type transport system ATP-binding protein